MSAFDFDFEVNLVFRKNLLNKAKYSKVHGLPFLLKQYRLLT